MVHHHGDIRDLLRASAIALDWRKCWLGAIAAASIVLGCEVMVTGTSLGALHLHHVPSLIANAGDPAARGVLGAWLLGAGLWSAFVLAFCGGGIARLAAIEFTTGRRPPLAQGIRFARRRGRAVFYGPLGALALAGLFAVPALLAGLAGRIGLGIGPMLVVVAYPLILGFTLLGVLLVIGTLGGWSLMVAAVAVEESDPFDAISRAMNYLYSRPWHALGYRLAAWAYGLIVCGASLVVGACVWLATEWLVGTMMGPGHTQLVAIVHAAHSGGPITWSTGGVLYVLVAAAFLSCMAGIALSYLYSSAVAEYLLLRQRVDGTSPSEMQLDERVEEYGELAFDPLLLDDEELLEDDATPPEESRDDQRVAGAHP